MGRDKKMRRRGGGAMVLAGAAMVLVAGCHRYRAPVPVDQLNAQQMAGKVVFTARCAQCHYDRTDAPKAGPSLLAVFQKPALHSGAAATDERVTATVMYGHGLMPAMGNVVDAQQMQDLLAYLHTL